MYNETYYLAVGVEFFQVHFQISEKVLPVCGVLLALKDMVSGLDRSAGARVGGVVDYVLLIA